MLVYKNTGSTVHKYTLGIRQYHALNTPEPRMEYASTTHGICQKHACIFFMHEIQVLNHACNVPERRPKSMHVTCITQAVLAGLRINPYFTDICWLSWTMDGYKHFQQFFGYLWSLMVASPHARAKLLLILPARHSLVRINRSQYVYHMHDHLRVASHVEHRQCVRQWCRSVNF